MDFALEMQVEPIVSKAEILEIARGHADAGEQVPRRNQYPLGTKAQLTYEIYFWQRVRELNGEEYS